MNTKELHQPSFHRLSGIRGKGGVLDEEYYVIKALEELDLEFERKINDPSQN